MNERRYRPPARSALANVFYTTLVLDRRLSLSRYPGSVEILFICVSTIIEASILRPLSNNSSSSSEYTGLSFSSSFCDLFLLCNVFYNLSHCASALKTISACYLVASASILFNATRGTIILSPRRMCGISCLRTALYTVAGLTLRISATSVGVSTGLS